MDKNGIKILDRVIYNVNSIGFAILSAIPKIGWIIVFVAMTYYLVDSIFLLIEEITSNWLSSNFLFFDETKFLDENSKRKMMNIFTSGALFWLFFLVVVVSQFLAQILYFIRIERGILLLLPYDIVCRIKDDYIRKKNFLYNREIDYLKYTKKLKEMKE